MAAGLQITESEGLVQIGADVVDQIVKCALPLPGAQLLLIGWDFLQQGRVEQNRHLPVEHVIESQPGRKQGIHRRTGIDVVKKGMNLPR